MTSWSWRHLHFEHSQLVQYFTQLYSFTTRECYTHTLRVTRIEKPDRQWRSSSFHESKKVRVSRDLWRWPWPWAHPGCRLTWRPSCAILVAIRPFAWEKKRFAQKFTDGRTDRRRTPRHCISSFLELANEHVRQADLFKRLTVTFIFQHIYPILLSMYPIYQVNTTESTADRDRCIPGWQYLPVTTETPHGIPRYQFTPNRISCLCHGINT